jgi:hypothetical protein
MLEFLHLCLSYVPNAFIMVVNVATSSMVAQSPFSVYIGMILCADICSFECFLTATAEF